MRISKFGMTGQTRPSVESGLGEFDGRYKGSVGWLLRDARKTSMDRTKETLMGTCRWHRTDSDAFSDADSTG